MRLNQFFQYSILCTSCCLCCLPCNVAAQTQEVLSMDLIELLGELDEKDQENLEQALLEAEHATPLQPPQKTAQQKPSKGK